MGKVGINQRPVFSGSLSGAEELFSRRPQESQIQVPELPEYLTLRYVEPAPSTVTNSLIWVGGLSLVAGAVFHGLSYSSAQDATDFQAARGTPIDYQNIKDSFELQRTASIVSYGLSLATTLSLSGIRWYKRYKRGKAQKMKPITLRMSSTSP